MPLDPNYRKTRFTHSRGTRAAQPLASDVLEGTLYFVTDEGAIERSNGTIWESFSGTSFGSGLRGTPGIDGLDGENTEIMIIGTNPNIPIPVPGGVSGQVQFNNSGQFAGDSDFTFSVDTLTITKAVIGNSLIVDTDTLVVDPTNNRVGIGTASPGNALHVKRDGDAARFEQSTGRNFFVALDSGGGGFFNTAGETGEGFYLDAIGNTVRVFCSSSERVRFDASSNIGIGTTSFGTSAAKVIGIANGTAPTSSPAGMGQLYVESGALKYRGSSGTVTTVAVA